MISRNRTARLLNIALGFALLIGLSPTLNHMSPLQTVSAGTVMTYQNDMVPGNADNNTFGSCCDAMGPASLVCDFMVSQSACVALYGGSEQVINSDPIIHSIYIKAVTPPPKF